MLIGSAIGLALGRNHTANKFFDSWLILILNLPALVIIALSYVWIGPYEGTAILATAINKIPNVAVQMREGARSLSRDLDEMAAVYRLGWWKTFQHVTIPQLAPFFAAAARSGLALVWKIVLVVASAVNIKFLDGAGGAALSGLMTMTAGGAVVLDFDAEPWYITSVGNAFVLNLSGAIQASGTIYTTQS